LPSPAELEHRLHTLTQSAADRKHEEARHAAQQRRKAREAAALLRARKKAAEAQRAKQREGQKEANALQREEQKEAREHASLEKGFYETCAEGLLSGNAYSVAEAEMEAAFGKHCPGR
jgi:peptidoglycan hydrolase CwlO-like protein